MVRLAHLSDVHVSANPLGWRLRDCFNKRLTSWINLRLLRRQKTFARADEVLARLMDDLPRRGIDHIVFSGDATAMGFAAECCRAAEVLRVGTTPIPGLAIPGNHDYLTRSAAASGDFERSFAPWQQGRRIDEHRYPFAQRAGDVWLIGVNAAVGHRLSWNAAGAVGPAQRDRLRRLLATLEPGPRILVVHYPIRLAVGARESWHHGLSDLSEMLAVAKAGGVCLWLHGHRHGPYFIDEPAWAPFPAICAGSATQGGIWSYNEYRVDGSHLQALRRAFNPATDRFEDVQTFEFRLQT
jgi:3',5'-cyclic AMP phosphodiesterase CpdA